MKIWIDADGCPRTIREWMFRTSLRRKVAVVLVANAPLPFPRFPLISQVVVEHGPDEADRHILEHSTPGDLVITTDIPLASALVDQGIVTLNPRGEVYTADNVKEALATRDLMGHLREAGLVQGGPPPLGERDKANFANAFDREFTRLQARSGLATSGAREGT